MLTRSIIEAIEFHEWVMRGWKVKFLLSERLLHQVKKMSPVDEWYDDPIIVATVMDRLGICFISIQEYYTTFGLLPQIGDRLFNEDSGMLIQDRSIDGTLKTLTFTLST
ncbi:hypothetical protein ACFSUS_26140 [Spirosoma soli]|uniref:Uncharacterized protein n=1 Tax=Spirosoma soli TaxID=1770529 RepID=A0ABW5MCA6_9BACT